MKYFFTINRKIFSLKIFSTLKNSTFKPCFDYHIKLVNEIHGTIAALGYDVC